MGIPQPPESGLFAWLPGLWVLRHYRRSWLARDIGAGLVLTTLLVPAGMGYAEAAGLPAITGLYATILPLIAYAIFGPSRIMVLGPDSALAALIGAAIVVPAAGDPAKAVADYIITRRIPPDRAKPPTNRWENGTVSAYSWWASASRST